MFMFHFSGGCVYRVHIISEGKRIDDARRMAYFIQ